MYRKFIAIDQWGNKEFLGDHPRKELIEKYGYKHVVKMYRTVNGVDAHVGWVIGPHWWEVLRLAPLDPRMPDDTES